MPQLTTGCISALICVLVFPSSATTRLQNSISKSLKSFSTLLDLLTSTFLLEKAIIKESKSTLKDAVQNHASAFKTLKSDLAEAKHERIFDPRIRGNKLALYDAAIGSLARLAQHLNGLRSSTRLQEDLIRAAREGSRSMNVDLLGGSASVEPSPVALSGTVDEEMSASIRLLTRFRHLAGAQLDDLVVSWRVLPTSKLTNRTNATTHWKLFNHYQHQEKQIYRLFGPLSKDR